MEELNDKSFEGVTETPPSKKSVFIGLGISFLALLVSSLAGYLFFILPGVSILAEFYSFFGFALCAGIHKTYQWICVFIFMFSLPTIFFLLLNYTLSRIFKNNAKLQKGIIWGYLWLILFTLYPISIFSAIQYNANQDALIKDAVERRDVAFCQEVKDLQRQRSCIFNIAMESKDLSICDKITIIKDEPPPYYSQMAKSDCERTVTNDLVLEEATQKNMASLCMDAQEKIGLLNTQSCIKIVARTNKNPEACNLFEEVNMRDECYWRAVEGSDRNTVEKYCNLIEYIFYKRKCTEFLNKDI